MADFHFGEGLHKVFLAGVGALATTAEKAEKMINDLVAKGELTVTEGKELNEELKHTMKERRASAKGEAAQSDADAGTGSCANTDSSSSERN